MIDKLKDIEDFNNFDLTINDLLYDNLCREEFEFIDNEKEEEQITEFCMPYHPDPDEEYRPRDYQKELWEQLFNRYTEKDFDLGICAKEDIGKIRYVDGSIISKRFRRMILVWHRRAGKDINTWQMFLLCAVLQPGVYYYMLPTIAQGRKAIFDTIANDGTKFIDYLPKQLYLNGVGWNKQEMKIEIDLGEVNGVKRTSIIQILGSDNYDRIVGTNPKGIVFSEFALCNPVAWDFFRPILRANNGFAWFISTPRGKNHFFHLVERAKELVNSWFVSIKTIDDTKIVVSKEQYLEEIEEGMEEAKARQEYYCDFNAPVKGTYYSDLINKVYDDGRYEVFFPNKSKPCFIAFDIGMNDTTCLTFWQETEDGFDIIDFYENNGEALDHYVKYIQKWEITNEIFVSELYFPHDMAVNEFAGGKKRIEVAKTAMPDKRCFILDKTPIQEGIDCVRRVLGYCRFRKKEKNKNILRLLDSLANYRKVFNDKTQQYNETPLHDWASNPADSFRYFSLVVDKKVINKRKKGKLVKAANMSQLNKGL
jgi:hypothetical protein